MMLKRRFISGWRADVDAARLFDGQTDPPPRRRRKSRIASLCMILSVGAIFLPLLASTAAAVASTPGTTPIGKQLAGLKGSNTVAGDIFGYSVAVSGTTAVVGAPYHASYAGRAYVFTKTATGWKQVAELKGSDTVAGDDFGSSVAISGTTAVVGAPDAGSNAGRAYVFTKTGKGWKQVTELKVAGDHFGSSVAISGTRAIVGAADLIGLGQAYVFTEMGGAWKQAAELKNPNAGFGYSVAISGTTAVVGAPGGAFYAGLGFVFTKTATGWKQVAELKVSDSVTGEFFGYSVAISGTTAVVGTSGSTYERPACVFTKTAAGWKQAAELKSSKTVARDYFGFAVAISGTTAVVGAPGPASGTGRAYVFTKKATGWKQAAELKGSGTLPGDAFGVSVAISGATAVVGGDGHAKDAGRGYVFEA
jgi:FG-GAP repeat